MKLFFFLKIKQEKLSRNNLIGGKINDQTNEFKIR